MQLQPEYPVRTARLQLRPLTAGDTDAILAYRSLPEVCRWVPFEPMDRAAVTARLEDQWARTGIEAEGESVTLGIEVTATGELIGDVILSLHSVLHRAGEVGWVLNPAHGGRGYATEAATAVLRLAFEELLVHRVVARVDARNEASLRLCARLGLRREAHLVANEWFKGGWSDEIDFALLEEEWAAQRSSPLG